MEDFEKRKFIRNVMEELDKLSKDNYTLFETALVIWLRSDKFQLDNYIDDSDIESIETLVDDTDSLLDEYIRIGFDNIVYSCDED